MFVTTGGRRWRPPVRGVDAALILGIGSLAAAGRRAVAPTVREEGGALFRRGGVLRFRIAGRRLSRP